MELKKMIYKALENVNDPEIHKNLIELDMIGDVIVEDDNVIVNVTLTTMGCPLKSTISEDVKKEVLKVEGVKNVEVTFGEMSKAQKDKLIQKLSGRTKKEDPLKNTRIIAVGSGKGGVGKSTVSANLAIALAKKGFKVGLIDADILGYSIPQLMGIKGIKPMMIQDGLLLPIEKYGVKVMSIGNLVDTEDAIIWRGPMLGKMLDQFYYDVYWGDLDYMLIDLPPGTGDMPLSLMQQIPRAEILIVTTPQITAADVAKRLAFMANKTSSKIIGLIENMSYFVCDNCDKKHFIFGKEEGDKLSEELNTKLLGEIPLFTEIREGSDKGNPLVTDDDSSVSHIYENIVKNLVK